MIYWTFSNTVHIISSPPINKTLFNIVSQTIINILVLVPEIELDASAQG